MSLNKRIQILLAFLVGVPFLLLLFESYRNGRTTLLKQMRSDALHTAQHQAVLVNDLFSLPRQAAKDLARAVGVDEKMSPATIQALVRRTLEETRETAGFCVTIYDGCGKGQPWIPYACWKNGKVEVRPLDDATYGFRKQERHTRAIAERRGIWSKPYFDHGAGEALMLTYSTPIFREGRIIGLATCDVALDQMVARMQKMKPAGNGHVYLVGPDGTVLAHPILGALADTSGTPGTRNLGVLNKLLADEGEDAISARDPFTQQQVWLVEVPIPNLTAAMGGPAWSLIVSWPEEVRTKPLTDMGKRFLVLYLALGGAAMLFLNRSMKDLVSRPIARMARQAHRFATGDFGDLGHPTEEAPELKELGDAVQKLGATLKGCMGSAPKADP